MLGWHSKIKTLESAVVAGNLEEIRRISSNESIESTEHYNILKKAISSGQIEAAKLLINRGCKLHSDDEDTDSSNSSRDSSSSDSSSYSSPNNEILHLAIETGNLELVQLLIQKNVSTRDPDKNGIPPIFKIVDLSACDLVYLKFLNCLLENGARIDSKWDFANFTILHYAAEKGNAKIIPLLLEKKCKINEKSSDGSTALHIATKKGFPEVVKVLLNFKAEDTICDINNMTPLCLSVENKNSYVFKPLLQFSIRDQHTRRQFSQRPDNQLLLSLAISVENGDLVNLLLLHGTPANSYSIKTGQSVLHEAVEKGNIKIIKLLLKHNANLNTSNREGFTPLHLACTKGYSSIVSAFLNTHKCDLNIKSDTNSTALHLSAREGHNNLVSLLLKEGADYKVLDHNNKSALTFVLENTHGDAKFLENFLRYIRQTENVKGPVPIEDKLLINYHSRARRDKLGNSALHLAVLDENVAAVILFLKHQACIHILNKKGHTPFDLAFINKSLSIIDIFLQNASCRKSLLISKKEDGYTPMHLAVETENIDILELFFKNGISADISKPNTLTPLHIAVQKNDKNMIAFLLRNGAKIDVSGRTHLETPLSIAVENGNIEVLELLLEALTARSSEWKEGYLLLYVAAFYGHEKIVKLLLDRRVNPNASVVKYLTPLHAAAQRGHENIVHLLLERGAKTNLKRKDNADFISTPLIAASYAGHSRIVNLLLDHGADCNRQLGTLYEKFVSESERILTIGSYKESEIGKEGSLRGYNSLHFAVASEDEIMVKSLINRGAVLNIVSESGTTAIGLAIKKENASIIQLLLSSGINALATHQNNLVLKMGTLKTNLNIADMIVKHICSSQGHSSSNIYNTPLGIAVENELEDYVKVLLEAQADASIIHKGEPLLHIAVKKKNCAIVEMLLKCGVDINLSTNESGTALMTAVVCDNEHAVKLLLNAGADTKISKYYSSRSYKNYDDIKPLHVAVLNKNATIVGLFLKKEGLISYVGDLSPFRLALQISSPKVVQTFLNHGASLNKKGKNGKLPLFNAVNGDNLEVIHFLLKKGVLLTSVNKQGDTILHVALKCMSAWRSELTVKLLLDYGIDVDIKNKDGYTPLNMLLNEKFSSDTVRLDERRSNFLKLFLSNGADPNQMDNSTGRSMLELAIRKGDPELVILLLLNGANVDVVNKNNETPLNAAIANCKTIYGPFSYRIEQMRNRNLDSIEYDDYSRRDGLIIKVACVITKEVARRQAITDDLDERNRHSVESEYVKKYYDRCQQEIELMKVTEIHQGISYFDLLTANYTRLAALARNNAVKEVLLRKSEVKNLFPEYIDFLNYRLETGRDRRLLLDSSHQLLRKILRFDFPLENIEHIFSFLANRDLRNLNSCFDKDMFID